MAFSNLYGGQCLPIGSVYGISSTGLVGEQSNLSEIGQTVARQSAGGVRIGENGLRRAGTRNDWVAIGALRQSFGEDAHAERKKRKSYVKGSA